MNSETLSICLKQAVVLIDAAIERHKTDTTAITQREASEAYANQWHLQRLALSLKHRLEALLKALKTVNMPVDYRRHEMTDNHLVVITQQELMAADKLLDLLADKNHTMRAPWWVMHPAFDLTSLQQTAFLEGLNG